MSQTDRQYREIIASCRSVFERKGRDYGTSWRVLRATSLTDQLFIKAQRIRTIEETGVNRVGEHIQGEFVAIVNYCIMGLIQMKLGTDQTGKIATEETLGYYDEQTQQSLELMREKNHDYGEAWRHMRVSSLTDLILMKILRVKQIEDNQRKTIVSEGIDANYLDILNYAVFALIRLDEEASDSK